MATPRGQRGNSRRPKCEARSIDCASEKLLKVLFESTVNKTAGAGALLRPSGATPAAGRSNRWRKKMVLEPYACCGVRATSESCGKNDLARRRNRVGGESQTCGVGISGFGGFVSCQPQRCGTTTHRSRMPGHGRADTARRLCSVPMGRSRGRASSVDWSFQGPQRYTANTELSGSLDLRSGSGHDWPERHFAGTER